MKEKIAELALSMALAALLAVVTPEKVRALIFKIIDIIEQRVKDTPNKYDDAIVLVLTDRLRKAMELG